MVEHPPRSARLATRIRATLAEPGCANVHLRSRDGYRGRPEQMSLESSGSLIPAEPYGLTAFPLAENEILGRDVAMDARSQPQVPVQARGHVVHDARQPGIPFR